MTPPTRRRRKRRPLTESTAASVPETCIGTDGKRRTQADLWHLCRNNHAHVRRRVIPPHSAGVVDIAARDKHGLSNDSIVKRVHLIEKGLERLSRRDDTIVVTHRSERNVARSSSFRRRREACHHGSSARVSRQNHVNPSPGAKRSNAAGSSLTSSTVRRHVSEPSRSNWASSPRTKVRTSFIASASFKASTNRVAKKPVVGETVSDGWRTGARHPVPSTRTAYFLATYLPPANREQSWLREGPTLRVGRWPLFVQERT
jgi:hypothetical protein